MKLSDLKAGDQIKTDDGFSCMSEGLHVVEWDNYNGWFVRCSEGKHCLDGQEDERGGYQ